MVYFERGNRIAVLEKLTQKTRESKNAIVDRTGILLHHEVDAPD